MKLTPVLTNIFGLILLVITLSLAPQTSQAGSSANSKCAEKIEALSRLFSDQDDDFPSQVNRLELYNFLTAEHGLIFSELHYRAIEKTFADYKMPIKDLRKKFSVLNPTEVNEVATVIWQNMVNAVNEMNYAQSFTTLEGLHAKVEERAKLNEKYNAPSVQRETVLAIEANPEIRQATIEIFGAALKDSLQLAPRFITAKKVFGFWKANKGAVWGKASGLVKDVGFMGSNHWLDISRKNTFNGWATAAGVAAGGLLATNGSAIHGLEVFAASQVVTPAIYTTVQLSRAAYNRTAELINKRLKLRKVKGVIERGAE